jgi:hypothetical protein
MKRSDLTIVAALLALVMVAAFWVVLLSPKRHQAADLQDQIDQVRSSVEQQQQEATSAEHARQSFGTDYRKLIVLGKAVPEDSDQPSLVVQLQQLADRAGVEFDSLELSGSGGGTTSPSPSISAASGGQVTPAPQAAASSTAGESTGSSSATPTSSGQSTSTSTSSSTGQPTDATAPAVPTEATAAALPLGASVGPAGLPIMPYDLTFTGDYFGIADFLKSLDSMVHARGGHVSARGRLLTVDGFSLSTGDATTGETAGSAKLSADFSVTAYLTPADQGTTAGASPGGPAPATPAPVTPTPASSGTSTASATPTSSPAPTP